MNTLPAIGAAPGPIDESERRRLVQLLARIARRVLEAEAVGAARTSTPALSQGA